MPFIEPKERPEFDPVVDLMEELEVCADGDLSYILFKYCKYHIPPSYNSYKNYLGELTECAAIIRKEILIPYEMRKKRINGDI